MAKKIQAPRGTRDLWGRELDVFNHIRGHAASLSGLHGFQQVELPMFEDIGLYARGLGAGSDAVSKEMFRISGPDEIPKWALRPEPTAGLVRAFVQRGWHARPLPQRYWLFGPMFRYDRPQTGRYRQFYQWDVEILGDPGPWTDADLVGMAVSFFSALGIPVIVHVNSIGDEKCRPRYREALVDYFAPLVSDLTREAQQRLHSNPMRILDDKALAPEIAAGAPRATDFLCSECEAHFGSVRRGLDATDLNWVLNHRLVRGLDYYTRTTFEIFEVGHEDQQAALGGGGRYDGLVSYLGGIPTAGIGFGVGIDRTAAAHERRPGYSAWGSISPDTVAVIGDEESGSNRLRVAQLLRKAEVSVYLDGTDRPLGRQLDAASKRARVAVFVGPDLQELQIRRLTDGAEEAVSIEDLVERVRASS